MKNTFIPFANFTSVGGPSTFMLNLRNYFDKNNFTYDLDYQEGDNIFFPVSYNIDILKGAKENGGKIIQRLDGIYYPSKHGDKHIELNKDIKEIYLNYTDYVIFQSKYSVKQCFEMLGFKKKKEYGIIINGADNSIFYPALENRNLDKVKFITTGNFRNIDMIEPVILAFDSLYKENLNFELNVVGPIVNESIKHFFEKPYIVYHGSRKIDEVADLLRNSDIFVYSHLNPPCPNSVIEAISCGLPVVGFNSGSMEELCCFNKDLLAYVSCDIFQEYRDFDYTKLKDKILLCIENFDKYKRKAIKYSKSYSFDKCGKKYIEVFKKINRL